MSLFCAVLLSSCRTTAPASLPVPVSQAHSTVTVDPKRAPIHLTIVGTNDLHGWAAVQKEAFPQGELRYGGVAALSAYLQVLREENPEGVLLLDAGDLFQGTLMSNLTEGSVVIEAFNQLRYDAASIGNHEFDYGPIGPVSAATQPSMDPFGALKARLAQSKFPLLSTNIYEASSGLRPAWLKGDGTLLLERHGLKIGIIGLTTPQTPTVTLPINVASLKFGALAPEAMTSAQRLRAKGADLVIAVVHAGGKCGDCTHPHDLTSCDTESGEVFEMMKGLPEGTLDAVVAGHTHAQIAHFVNGTPIIESGALGKYFGTIDLYVDAQTKKVLPEQTALQSAIEICETVEASSGSCDARRFKGQDIALTSARFHGRNITPDPELLAVLKPAEQQVAELQMKRLGVLVPDSLGRLYEGESALGSMLADSLRSMTRADIAILNPGGLRADLRKGPLTYGGVYEVMPFDNQIATLELTGEQLKRLLIAAYASRKGVFQISGLEVKLNRCPGNERLRSFTVGGKPVDEHGHYTVVMPDFLARGGDGMGPMLATVEPERVDLGNNRATNLRDELVAWWQDEKRPLIAPKPGRVVFLDSGVSCSAGAKIDTQSGVP